MNILLDIALTLAGGCGGAFIVWAFRRARALLMARRIRCSDAISVKTHITQTFTVTGADQFAAALDAASAAAQALARPDEAS